MARTISAGIRIRVGLVCLVPDGGHALPLGRVARCLARAGIAVRLFGPDEIAPLFSGSGLDIVTFGRVKPELADQAFKTFAETGYLGRKLFAEHRLADAYFGPLQESVLRSLDQVTASLVDFRPDVIIADDHLFRGAYKWLAEQCGVPLVLHYSAGTTLTRLKRMPWHSSEAARLKADFFLFGAYDFVRRHVLRIFCRDWSRRRAARLAYLQGRWVETRVENALQPTYHIATGTGLAEQRQLLQGVDVSPGMVDFAPLPPLHAELSQDIAQWLDAVSRPVVYVCLGTIIQGSRSLARKLVEACRSAGMALLWVSRELPVDGFESGDVKWLPWVSQPAVLEHPSVAVFLSHVGAGSLQEAVRAGTPILCLPFMTDQFYNAWVAEEFGVGVRLDRTRLSAATLDRALARAVGSTMQQRARQLRDEIASMPGEEKLVAFIESCVPATDGHIVNSPLLSE